MITARAQKMERGAHGNGEITEEDICHALALIRVNGAALLLRVKIAGQERFKPELVKALIHIKRFRFREELADLCQLAVDEFCAPALCRTCNGRESHRAGDLIVICPTCNGSGKYHPPNPAQKMGIRQDRWANYQPVYEDLLKRLSLWEDIGIEALNRI